MKYIALWRWPLAAIAAWGGVAQAQPGATTAALGRVMAVARANQLSGEVALSDIDGTTADDALGLADREGRRPHRPGARWLWASVTKQVTATLVMQQVETGTLALDGTIRSYLPDFAGPTGDVVTVRQLLQHVSGLPNPDETSPAAGGRAELLHGERASDRRRSSRARLLCGTDEGSAGGRIFLQ